MNIFGDDKAKESDHNDIKASSLSITITPMGDNGFGATSIQIIPRLVDSSDKPISFTGAALETTLEIYSNGVKLSTAKNLMQDNNFKGFNLKFSSLLASSVVDGKIDVTVSVKTTNKTFRMSKVGIEINSSALKVPEPLKVDSLLINEDPNAVIDPSNSSGTVSPSTDNPTTTPSPAKQPTGDPKNVVSKFLNNVNSQNLRAAFDSSSNPSWGSYESFSNPTSGFGAIKSVSIKNVTTNGVGQNLSSVNAVYEVTDKNGKATSIKATFGLKNVNGEWKISSYKITQ